MKTKKLAIFLFTLILAIGLLPMSVFAAQREVVAGSTASITVNSAVENDVLAAYKVIDITYDAGTNHLTYAWNSDFADYFAGTTSYNTTAYTVEDFAALTSESDSLKNLLAQLPNYIASRTTLSPAKTATVDSDGNATFAGLAMGEYFIRPTSSTSVYQLMLQKVEPIADNGKYVIDDVSFTAKKEEVTITKTADKTSVTKNEKVNYTITADIPTYASNTTDKSFYISDLLPDGLTIDTDSITVKIDGVVVDAGAYTLAKTPNTTVEPYYTFKLSVDTDNYDTNWAANGGKKLVITYSATFNDNDTTEVNTKETNTVTFDYSYYPYDADSHNQKTATADVTTFAIKIDKFVSSDTSKKLAGAKFDLYRTATQAEVDANTAVDIPQTTPTIKGIRLEGDIVTNDSGVAIFEKYEANDTNYDYYLVETQAPSGYNILDNAVKVNFSDTDVAATAGIYTVEVPNSSGIKLPITGGEGIVLFTIIGFALMGSAVILLMISRRKPKTTEKK